MLITFNMAVCFRGRSSLTYRSTNVKLLAKKSWAPPPSSPNIDPMPTPLRAEAEAAPTGVAFIIDLPKRAGINWGSDLSFRWIKVLSMDPNGEAALSNVIQKVKI